MKIKKIEVYKMIIFNNKKKEIHSNLIKKILMIIN
jgi:hypothetical protein